MSERIWYLKNCNIFEQLPPDELKQVERRCRMRKFQRKSPIYLPADNADGVLLVGSGRVKISSFTAEGKQSILTFIEPGELFGELSIVTAGTRDEYAEATEPATILLLPADEMQRLVGQFPLVSLGVTKLIGLRRKRVERRLKYLLFHSNRERLVYLLLELVEQYGKQSSHGIELGIKLSHQDLANIIGSTRETVTVILGNLQAEKCIRMARRKITLTNLEKLAAGIKCPPPTVENTSNRWTSAPKPGQPAKNTI